MKKKNTRAWKNKDFRLSSTAERRAPRPVSPVRSVELTDKALDDIVGGSEASPAGDGGKWDF